MDLLADLQSTMTTWSEAEAARFVRVVLDEARKRAAGDLGFRKAAWGRILERVNAGGRPFTRAQLQSKWQSLKRKHDAFAALRADARFAWCARSGRPTAADHVWDAYLKEHPGAREFRHRPLELYAELHEIFTGVAAPSGSADVAGNGDGEAGSNGVVDQGVETRVDARVEPQHLPAAPRAAAAQVDRRPGGDGSGDSSRASTDTARGIDATITELVSSIVGVPEGTDAAVGGRARGKRAAQELGERVVSALEQLAEAQKKRAKQCEEQRTPVQQAIADFLQRFGAEYEPGERVRYVVYLTSHPRLAEAYNVLDDSTRRAFIASLELDG